MTDAAFRYVLSATIALVAMVGRIGWLIRPEAGEGRSSGYVVCLAIVGTAVGLALLASVPTLLAFLVAEGRRALSSPTGKEARR